MSSHTTALTEELARDYANYVKLDLSTQMKTFNETIEDVMTRLEEFESIVTMVQAESLACRDAYIPQMMTMQQEVTKLCKRIDALEHFITVVNTNLNTLETAVENAEAELGVSDRLFGILNPLSFFKKSSEPAAPNRLTTFEPPAIYRTDAFFNSELNS